MENRPFGEVPGIVRRLIADGVDRRDLQRLARWVAYVTVFEIINRVDEGYDPNLAEDLPGWRLMEVVGEEVTGRDVGGLHESLLQTDPSGREGRPV